MSWKVRRSASRVLAAIILTRTELLSELLKSAAPALVSRFNEREENVRIENFNTFIVLMKRVGSVHKQAHAADSMDTSDRFCHSFAAFAFSFLTNEFFPFFLFFFSFSSYCGKLVHFAEGIGPQDRQVCLQGTEGQVTEDQADGFHHPQGARACPQRRS